MHRVWGSQGAGDRLITRLLPVGHTFNAAMQDEAFEWLDRRLRLPAVDPKGTGRDR